MKLKILRWGRLSWITHVDLMLSQVFSEADRERLMLGEEGGSVDAAAVDRGR